MLGIKSRWARRMTSVTSVFSWDRAWACTPSVYEHQKALPEPAQLLLRSLCVICCTVPSIPHRWRVQLPVVLKLHRNLQNGTILVIWFSNFACQKINWCLIIRLSMNISMVMLQFQWTVLPLTSSKLVVLKRQWNSIQLKADKLVMIQWESLQPLYCWWNWFFSCSWVNKMLKLDGTKGAKSVVKSGKREKHRKVR